MPKITTPQRALMQRLFLVLFAILVTGFAWAGTVLDALAAQERKDYALALKIVKPSAINGEAWAQNWLAEAYDQGQGVVRDYAEAAKWYRLAAEQGVASAQYNLGVMYSTGQLLVKQDYYGIVASVNVQRTPAAQGYAEAAKWYRLAAEQGVALAQYNLGVMYTNGEGVMQDYVKAHSWFNLSAVNGNTDARNGRDVLAKQMTPQQIADAQKLAQDCQARQLKGCD